MVSERAIVRGAHLPVEAPPFGRGASLTIFGARLVGNDARRFKVVVDLPRTLLPGKDTSLIVHSCPASSPPRRAV
jgi:hypothetical protein